MSCAGSQAAVGSHHGLGRLDQGRPRPPRRQSGAFPGPSSHPLQSIIVASLTRSAGIWLPSFARFRLQIPGLWRDAPGGRLRLPTMSLRAGATCPDCRNDKGKPQFPAFIPPDGSSSGEYLHRLVLEGLQRRYGSRAAQFCPQAMEELGIINEVGYEEYFLITWDFLQECRRRGIEWITCGSAADSLVCYCLGISGVCPIRFDVYFRVPRRFLNKDWMAMNKLPDIDIDFAHDLKDDMVKLIFEKYGREHCAVVGGFSTFQVRSSFVEVAKVLGVAEREVRKFTDHFP
jgi:hypothetical protein